MNPSFWLMETYFLSSGNSMLLFRAFSLWLETMIEIMGINFNRNIFSSYWKPFSIFLSEEAVFSYSGSIFFNKCLIQWKHIFQQMLNSGQWKHWRKLWRISNILVLKQHLCMMILSGEVALLGASSGSWERYGDLPRYH